MGDVREEGHVEEDSPVLSVVVIGYNEGATLGRCLESIREADLRGIPYELLYVDSGSEDGSIQIAEEAGVDRVLGGDRRRRAAESRNLGLRSAQGEYVQFLDGDMALIPDWIRAGLDFLGGHRGYAAVHGDLREANQSLLFRALELDWASAEGDAAYCGGAALYRREALMQVDGFPEDLAYGEEPYLCWRIRNELGLKIWKSKALMADHDLGYRGFGAYWRRMVRVGSTYAEVSWRCLGTPDRLWLWPCISNVGWAFALLAAAGLIVLSGYVFLQLAGVLFLAVIFVRKVLQTFGREASLPVAIFYAAHTYGSKFAMAYGQLRWWIVAVVRRMVGRKGV